MAGPAEGKYPIKAKVYLHEQGKSRAKITHIDIEAEEIGEIIKEGETTYCAGKKGGCFIGLKKEMLERAKKIIEKKKK
ncbi:MAG: hypothetical protein NZ889_00530 [Candidatus Pacearchaeota archaeon]|nr:hypothetical protein [Candidatus Pacearchaeota archaeon]